MMEGSGVSLEPHVVRRLPGGGPISGDSGRPAHGGFGTFDCLNFEVKFMSTRVAFALVCLVGLVLIPFTGCTPPASQDVQFVSGGVTGSGSCCPGSTAIPGECCSGATGEMAVVLPGTTAAS